MAARGKGTLIMVLVALAAIACAVILAFHKFDSSPGIAPASRSPKFKHKVRNIQYFSQPDKPVRRDDR